MRWLVFHAARLVLLGLCLFLLVSAFIKLGDPASFREAIRAQGLLSPGLASSAVYAVPWLEYLAALGGLVGLGLGGRAARLALLVTLLLLSFAVYAMALHWFPPHKPAPCGCAGGKSPVENWSLIALRNGGAAALAAVAIIAVARGAEPAARPTLADAPPA
ncbi:MAG: hypothetical protein IPM33_04100 [Phycisphaerales bacterium]|nr:hypothetical protein [Phycisphaerales bacterium]